MLPLRKVSSSSFSAEARDYPQGINVDRKPERAWQQYKLSMTEGGGGRS